MNLSIFKLLWNQKQTKKMVLQLSFIRAFNGSVILIIFVAKQLM